MMMPWKEVTTRMGLIECKDYKVHLNKCLNKGLFQVFKGLKMRLKPGMGGGTWILLMK